MKLDLRSQRVLFSHKSASGGGGSGRVFDSSAHNPKLKIGIWWPEDNKNACQITLSGIRAGYDIISMNDNLMGFLPMSVFCDFYVQIDEESIDNNGKKLLETIGKFAKKSLEIYKIINQK